MRLEINLQAHLFDCLILLKHSLVQKETLLIVSFNLCKRKIFRLFVEVEKIMLEKISFLNKKSIGEFI